MGLYVSETRSSSCRAVAGKVKTLSIIIVICLSSFALDCVQGSSSELRHVSSSLSELLRERQGHIHSELRRKASEAVIKKSSVEPTVRKVFEVDVPIDVPSAAPKCTIELLKYDFANTIVAPPVVTPYTPDPACGTKWSTVTLKWSSRVTGIQYDRFAAVWLSGVEILRTSTAEPLGDGLIVEWEVEKDITRYSSMFLANQTVVVSLPNLVSSQYTGIYNTTITASFYETKSSTPSPEQNYHILPISRPSPFNASYWFNLGGSPDVHSSNLTIPRNTVFAFVEVYISFHGDDEFWYTTAATVGRANATSTNPGPFREVVLSIDGKVAGAVWPSPVLFTGAYDPNVWSPVVGIGTFNLPSYFIDITPFVGELVDGLPHSFSLEVVNAVDFWLVDANLFLSLDPLSLQTSGRMTEYSAPPYEQYTVEVSSGTTGSSKYLAKAARNISFAGYVTSSTSNYTYSWKQTLKYQQIQTVSDLGTADYNQLTEMVSHTQVSDNGKQPWDVIISASYPFDFEIGNAGLVLNRSVVETVERKTMEKTSFLQIVNTQQAQEFSPTMRQTISYNNGNESCYNRELKLGDFDQFVYDKSDKICKKF